MTVALAFQDCPVVELRRYTLRPDRLPDLVAVFERHLIEPQEDCGMTVGGTFSDEDDPDCFTWLRGFADHATRVRGLATFYGGPVWARHAAVANATMLDSDDVLLLRPTHPAHRPAPAAPRGASGDDGGSERVLAVVHGVAGEADAVEDWFAATAIPGVEEVLNARVVAWRTDPTPNGFPRLPVRQDHVVTWLATFADGDARDAALARLASADVGRDLDRRTSWRRTLRLAPTARSTHPAPEPPRT